MRSVAQALSWEMLWRGRLVIPGSFLLSLALPMLVFGSLYRIAGFVIEPDEAPWIMLHLVFTLMMLLLMGTGILWAQGRIARLFPAPISTHSLVAWHMFSGAGLLALEAALGIYLLNSLFHLSWPIWGPTLYAIAACSVMQVFFVNTPRTLMGLFLAACPNLLLFVWLKCRYGGWFTNHLQYYWREIQPSEVATLLVTVGLSFAWAARSAARARCNEPTWSLGIGRWMLDRWDAYTLALDMYRPNYRSLQAAQFWYEWRQKGLVFPFVFSITLAFGGLITLLSQLGPEAITPAGAYQGAITYVSVMCMLSVASGGFLGLRGFGSDRSDMHDRMQQPQGDELGHFQATRPISIRDYADAILKTSALSCFLAWLIWATTVGALAWVASAFGPLPLMEGGQKIGWFVALSLLGPWVGMSVAGSLTLVGRTTAMTLWIVGLAFAAAALTWCIEAVVAEPLKPIVFTSVRVTCFIAIILVTLLAFWLAARRGFLGSGRAVACGLSAGVLILVGCLQSPQGFPREGYLLIVASASLVVLPLASMPLAFHWNRHR